MKAKTTWLIGLLIALMMVLTAVPAFAQEEQQPVEPVNEDVNVEAQADPNGIKVTGFSAKSNAYVGDKITFKVTISKGAYDNMPYKIKITDVSKGITANPATTVAINVPLEGVWSIPESNTIEIESDVLTSSHIGNHEFKIQGAKNVEGSTVEDLGVKNINVNVKPALTAYQTAYNKTNTNPYSLEAEINKPVTLSAYAQGGSGSYSFEWQESKTGSSPNVIDNEDWIKIATGDATEYTFKYEDDQQYIRCVVKDNDGNELVAPVGSEYGSAWMTQFKKTSKGTITITQPAQDSTVTLVEGQGFNPTAIEAEGGTTEGQYDYQWKKGSENVGTNNKLFSIDHVSKDDAGLYKCVVTDKTYPDKINATSKTTRLNVVSAPKFSIRTNKGEIKADPDKPVATWAGEGATYSNGKGTLYLSSADAENGVTLSLNVTGDLSDPNKNYTWTGAGVPSGQDNKPVTIKPVTAEDYTVTLSYPTYGLSDSNKATYTLSVVITGGSISATGDGITKQVGDKLTSPEYTLHLPTGTKFINDPTVENIKDWVQNEPDGLGVEVVGVATNKNAVTFKFKNKSDVKPYVKDLEVKIPKTFVTPVPSTEFIIFPVSSKYGFQITNTLTIQDIKIETPGTEDVNTNIYDGTAIAAKIVKKTELAPDIGTVSNVRYLDKKAYPEITDSAKRYEKASSTVPKDAGIYEVWCDVAKGSSKAYPDGASKLGPLEYKINEATPSKMEAETEGKGFDTYFTWTKSKKKTGSKLSADVKFQSGLTKTGKIESVRYFKDGVETQPVDVGVYDIVVTTVPDGTKNLCDNVIRIHNYKIGTFEITEKDPVPETKKDPTKDLYEMSPTSATADGKEHTTTVSIKDDYSDAGEVTATKYYDENGKKLSGKPSKAGEYTVKVDTEETDTYKAAKDLEIGTFTIKGATPTASMYTMDPKSGSSVTANGKGQGVKVTAKDPDMAGEATVKYYDKDGKAVSGQPVKAGVYTVRIDTAASDYYAAGKDIAMGTFEIKQGIPTKAMNLYKLDPDKNNYNGKANPTKVVPTGDNGAGEVEAIHYTRKSVSTQADTDAPVAIGTYTVSVDTKASDSFKAVKGLVVGDYQIVDQGIFLRAHVQNVGWMQLYELEPGGTVTVGTEGQSLRAEAIDIAVPAGYTVEGFAHIQNKGDTDCRIVSPSEADYPVGVPAGYTVYRFGSTGQSLRLEGILINLKAGTTTIAQIQYCVHVQNIGWLGYVNNNTFTGTRSQSLRLEALRFAYSNN